MPGLLVSAMGWEAGQRRAWRSSFLRLCGADTSPSGCSQLVQEAEGERLVKGSLDQS